MEWIDYLGGIANRKVVVNGLDGEKLLSPAEKDALLAVFPTQHEHLSFVQAGKAIYKRNKTLTTQFQSIYNKFTIDPPTPEELAKLLRIGFNKLQKEELQQQESVKTNVLLKIDWRTDCEKQLKEQKEQLTSSPIQGLKTRKLDDVHVPLGLMERKNKERPQFGNSQEILPERGSESYQQGYTETKRIEHDKFLAEMYKREAGQHIVILGEPGAGKTTILTRIWQWLLDAHPKEQIIIAWVPLTAVKNDGLEDYLKKSWIKQFCKSDQIPSYWKSFEELADGGRVWLLLDGVDEMGGDALVKIKNALNEKWAESIKAIVTCRLNLWDASPTNSLASSQDFQIYRTLDFKYDSPAGDEVEKFIDKWFKNQPETGKKLRFALEEEGKERIKDLVQNPLRLTLLCDIWEDNNDLPDTQANLYRRFVDYVYKFKADKFPNAYNLRRSLDRAMGVLAKQGINKANLRFRFNREELDESLPDIEHYDALTKLGWLNYLGKDEDAQEVYTFFHPTFQEYFAACNIPDWDYFLPRAHIDRPELCKGEDIPTYRVFEQEWQQVILFWIGRGAEDISDEIKEEFIKILTDFQGYEGGFYYYRAYIMAAIMVGEFKSSKQAKSIVKQIVEFVFGRFNSEKNKWESYLESIESLARATILFTHRQYAINSLQNRLSQSNSSDYRQSDVESALYQITMPNRKIVEDDSWRSGDLDFYVNPFYSELEKQKFEEQKIEEAITILNKNDYNNCFIHIKILGQIAVGHEGAIKALTTFIAQYNRQDSIGTLSCGSHVAVTLGKIAIGNKSAIKDLIDILQNDNVNRNTYFNVYRAISKIVTRSEMPLVIENVKEYLTEESRKFNSHRFNKCYTIIFQCAQSLTYPEFYKAWHQREDPASLNLEFSNDD